MTSLPCKISCTLVNCHHDCAAALCAMPCRAVQVADLMAAELGWGGSRRRVEVRNALAYLATFKAPPMPAPSAAAK